MNCYYHPGKGAVICCPNCQRGLCRECSENNLCAECISIIKRKKKKKLKRK